MCRSTTEVPNFSNLIHLNVFLSIQGYLFNDLTDIITDNYVFIFQAVLTSTPAGMLTSLTSVTLLDWVLPLSMTLAFVISLCHSQ